MKHDEEDGSGAEKDPDRMPDAVKLAPRARTPWCKHCLGTTHTKPFTSSCHDLVGQMQSAVVYRSLLHMLHSNAHASPYLHNSH